MKRTCTVCGGKGKIPGEHPYDGRPMGYICDDCGGEGEIEVEVSDIMVSLFEILSPKEKTHEQ